MTECHASKCQRPATMTLKVGNNHSFKDRWTSGLDYCEEHAEWVGWRMSERGLRVLLEDRR